MVSAIPEKPSNPRTPQRMCPLQRTALALIVCLFVHTPAAPFCLRSLPMASLLLLMHWYVFCFMTGTPPEKRVHELTGRNAQHQPMFDARKEPVHVYLSLSRLNHWLPRGQANTEVMQGTTDVHDQIADALFPQADPVFDDATALHTAVDMLDPQPTLVQRLVGSVLLQRQLLAAGFLGRHEDLHLRERERQEAQILQQPAPRGQGIRGRVGNPLVMDAASGGVAEEEEDEQGIDQQDIFDRMVLFLPALTFRLCSRVLGADDTPFRPVMGTRGEAGTAARGAGASSRGTTTVAASASETPSRCARAVRERAGASPRARSAASSAGKSTWIH